MWLHANCGVCFVHQRADNSCIVPTGAIYGATLPARGATSLGTVNRDYAAISIHAPREGSDSDSMQQTMNIVAYSA